MPQTFGQNWQDVNDTALPAIGSIAREADSSILARIDKHLDAPLRMGQSHPTPNSLLNFQPNQVETGDGKKRTTPPLDDTILSYAGATVDFLTGIPTGGTVLRDGAAFSLPGGYTPTHFVLAVWVYNSTANAINCTFSAGDSLISNLPNPGTLFGVLEGVPIGYVYLQAVTASTFKTAGSATNIIENKVGIDSRIFVFGGGTGSGGSGDSSFKAQALQANVLTLKKGFLMLDYQVELVTYNGAFNNFDIIFNLKTEVRTDGVTTPAPSTVYYLYIDLFSLGSEVSYGATDRKVFRVEKGTSGNLTVLATKPSATNPRRFVPLASLKTDGSSNYTVFEDLARRRHDSVAAFVSSPQTQTYQITSAASSTVTPHGMSGEPQFVNLYYFDGTKKIGLDSASHLLNKDSTNVEISSLGLTFGGGQYLEAQVVFHPRLPDSFVTIRHNYTSPWMTSNAVTTLLHSLGSDGIGGYEVQEWDVTAQRIRNIDRSALVINFDKDNFYLNWAGLLPTGNLQYRVISGATPIPSLNPFTRPFEISATFTARAWDEIIVKAATPLTMTLPLNPSVGDRVMFYDGLSNWDVNNVTVARNGQLINGIASNFTLNVARTKSEFLFIGGSQGWWSWY